MKKINYIPVIIAATVALSCTKTQFDDAEATSGGSANFSNYIAVGNSLTQGYQDGGLHNEYQQQENSYPAIIAKQMETSFLQPMVEGAGSGYRKLTSLAPDIIPVSPEASWGAAGWSTWDKTKQYNNMGVAGILLRDCVSGGTGNTLYAAANPYGGYQDLQTKTYLDNVTASNATFFTNWLGNNDVLSWATSGGFDDANGIPGFSALTPAGEFRTKYDAILSAFQTMGAKGVCATLADVTAIPFFTTVPHNPIPLDQANAAALNSAFAAYNTVLDNLVLAGAISSSEATQRKINFVAGATNAILIEDESLTDLTPYLPANSPYIKTRQATAADLILLTSSDTIGKVIGGDPTKKYGVTIPFSDTFVLTEDEVTEVQTRTLELNAEIRASAAANGNVAVVDMYAVMFELQKGMNFDGVSYTANYIKGGAFSLDGVHPNSRGYAIIANKFMETINSRTLPTPFLLTR